MICLTKPADLTSCCPHTNELAADAAALRQAACPAEVQALERSVPVQGVSGQCRQGQGHHCGDAAEIQALWGHAAGGDCSPGCQGDAWGHGHL